jgi:hypothetical protein
MLREAGLQESRTGEASTVLPTVSPVRGLWSWPASSGKVARGPTSRNGGGCRRLGHPRLPPGPAVQPLGEPRRDDRGEQGDDAGGPPGVSQLGPRPAVRTPPWTLVSDSLTAVFLTSDLLEMLAREERLPALENAIAESTGVHLPVYFVGLDLHRHQRSSDPTFPEDQLEVLARLLLPKIRAFAASGGLVRSRHLAAVIHSWKQWGDKWGFEAEAETWARATMESADGLVAILEAFRTRRYSDGRPPEFSLDLVEPFVPLDEAEARALEWLAQTSLAPNQREVLEAFTAAMPKYRDGTYGELFPGSGPPTGRHVDDEPSETAQLPRP